MYTTNPDYASNFVQSVDQVFAFILGVSFFFLIGLTAAMIYFMIRYRRDKHPVAVQNEGNIWLEITWTVIPLALVLLMFYFGWKGWRPMHNPPDEGLNVKAIARMWSFQFEYENGKRSDSLYVPVGEAVILDLVALDVLHSVYIPAFRVKEDMVPGQKKVMWFIPGQEGNYELFCTEYCGLQHSYMYTRVKVLSPEEFEEWYADTTAVVVSDVIRSPAEQGYQVLQAEGCFACHSINGTTLVGPTFLGTWGTRRTVVTNGQQRQVTFDEEYLRRSIYDPNTDLVEGFNPGLMLSYEGIVDEEQLMLIKEYLQSVNE